MGNSTSEAVAEQESGCCTPQNPTSPTTPPCKPCAPCGEKSDTTALAEKPAPSPVAPTSPPSKSCAPCGKKSDSSDPAQKPATSTAQQQEARAHENGLQQHPPIDENVAHQQAQQPHNENQQHQDEPSIPRPMMLAGATPIREPAPVKPEHQVYYKNNKAEQSAAACGCCTPQSPGVPAPASNSQASAGNHQGITGTEGSQDTIPPVAPYSENNGPAPAKIQGHQIYPKVLQNYQTAPDASAGAGLNSAPLSSTAGHASSAGPPQPPAHKTVIGGAL